MRATILTCLSLLLAASCTGTTLMSSRSDEESSVYGAFLAARYAGMAREAERSADLYAEALALAPQSAVVSERAFYAALTAGDFERADEAASRLVQEEDGGLQLAGLYLRAAALAEGEDYPVGAGGQPGAFGQVIIDILNDWSRARTRSGAREAALETFEVPGQAAPYALLHKAMIFEAAREWRRAEDAYLAAAQNEGLADLVTVQRGAFLERRGERQEAIELYRERLENDPHPDPVVEAALERALAGRRPPRLDPAEGAARSLYALSRLLIESAPADYTTLYLRLVQRLDPQFDRNLYSLAQMFETLALGQEALELYDSLEGGPFGQRAQVDAAWLLFMQGEQEAALQRAQALRDESMGDSPRLLLADIYRMTGRCDQAAPIYDDVVESRRARGEPFRWQPVFYEGVCHQQLGDWTEAEAHFLAALDIAPDEPRVLNHLGYNWIVFGERVEEGLAMVREAAALAPENGAVLDSVGWGLYKLGRYEEAVEWLERAVVHSPGNATINWHLGDAYARVGRDLEARFQWEHALALEPEPREEALLQARLEGGLDNAPGDLE